VFKITLNRELCTKLIQKKNSLPSAAHESQFSDKQKFHSAPEQRLPVSTEVLSNWPFILWLQGPAWSASWFTFLSRELSISWYEIMHLPILGNLPILGDFPLRIYMGGGFMVPAPPLGNLSKKSVEITNKMQPCNRIYYSNVYWRLNIFRAAHRSLSGALNCTCSLWFIYTCGDQPLTTASHHMCM
jgi:hypothetical protein